MFALDHPGMAFHGDYRNEPAALRRVRSIARSYGLDIAAGLELFDFDLQLALAGPDLVKLAFAARPSGPPDRAEGGAA